MIRFIKTRFDGFPQEARRALGYALGVAQQHYEEHYGQED